MKILTAQQMRAIDRRTIETFGVPEIVLMENAGRALFAFLRATFGPIGDRRLLLLIGPGNNGGDVLVLARHLVNAGIPFEALLFARPAALRGSAAINLAALRRAAGAPRPITGPRDWSRERRRLRRSDLIVDGILGTGLSRPVGGLLAAVFADVNASGATVVAVDIPSGLSGDTAAIPGPCLAATHTVALALPKVAHLLPPAAERVGTLWVADIGIPPGAVAAEKVALDLIEAEALRDALPPRPRASHKGTYGHVLLVAGSRGKGGAARMAALGALRAGCGLLTAAVPRALQAGFVSGAMEAMTEGLPEDADGALSADALPAVTRALSGKAAVAVGPGLGTGTGVRALVRGLVRRARVPLVLDADGLNAFAGDASSLRGRGRRLVLTPHPGEMARLLGTSADAVLADRVGVARDFARRHGCHVVLKGYRTLVATPAGRVLVNPTGNPGLAKGGSGDVLTGVLAGLLAQRLEVDTAVALGVYLHGLAADLAAAELGEAPLLARDVLGRLPLALRRLRESRPPESGGIRRIA
jgi:NAD(P)H-hydrate epimerase